MKRRKRGLSFASPRFRRFARRPAAARETPYVGADRIKFEGYALSGNRTPVSRALRKRRMARPLYIGNAEPEEPISSPAPTSSGSALRRRRQTTGPRTDAPQKPRGREKRRKKADGIDSAAKRNAPRRKTTANEKKRKRRKKGGPERPGKEKNGARRLDGAEKGQASERRRKKREAPQPEPGIRPRAARGARRETPRPKTQTRMFRAPSMILLSSSTLIS